MPGICAPLNIDKLLVTSLEFTAFSIQTSYESPIVVIHRNIIDLSEDLTIAIDHGLNTLSNFIVALYVLI